MEKPDIEWFCGTPYKAFCGECGKILYTGGMRNAIEEAKKQIQTCPHCGCEINWEVDK